MNGRNALTGLLAPVADCCALVVDDNPANTALVRKVLDRAGLPNVIEIQDPFAVADALREHDPDLILLDLRMPGMDGFAVLDEIRRFAIGSYLPVVVITADDSHESVERALSAGAHDFVRKPFDASELALRVRNLLVNRTAYLELRRNRAWLRDRLGLFEPDLSAVEGRADEARRAITEVMAGDALRMALQPVVDMRTGRVNGYEALARFPSQPFSGPGAWFAAALDLGLTVELEVECVRRAIRLVDRIEPGTLLGVNVSPATVLSGELERLPGVPWDRLVVELTEHVPVESYAALNEALAPLRAAGASLAVDDTGAGFASLRHILELKPDTIKIDIGIARGVDHDPSRAAVVTMLVDFAQRVGMMTLAEGIETEAERDTMIELGVHNGQGFLFGRPAVPD